MKRSLWLGMWLILAVVVALCFLRPSLMLSPGHLDPAHAQLADDCFACHAPLRGASARRCMSCHKLTEIGLRSTKGVLIVRPKSRPAFHQALLQADCMACHSGHPGAAPSSAKSINFDHALLRPDALTRCQACHSAPKDAFHQAQKASCAICHQPVRWKPATFDHARYFVLDRHHNAECTTCHIGGNFKRYTCYGCHEHQPANVVAKHSEEGITNIENCVRCHRSARGEAERGERRDREE